MIEPTTVNGLELRAVLGKSEWLAPQRHGPDGWRIMRRDQTAGVIASAAVLDDIEWVHASIAHFDNTIPGYDELVLLHRAVFGTGFAYQVFAPPSNHIDIYEYALHLWGRSDGAPALPDFGRFGTI